MLFRSKGLQRDYAGKIQVLNKLITDYPSSAYLDDALYEQGRAFVQMEDSENASVMVVSLVMLASIIAIHHWPWVRWAWRDNNR